MIKLASALVLVSCAFAQPRSGLVHFDWDKLAAKATEKVDLNLEGPMLEMASKFLSNDKEDEAAVKKLVQGLKGVYVKTFEFDKEGQFSESDLNDIRTQLRGPGWSTMMDMRDHGESVSIYLRSDGKQTLGMAVLAAEPRELTFVQIDGPIDPSTLGSLGGKLGIPKMTFGSTPRPAPAPKPAPRKKND